MRHSDLNELKTAPAAPSLSSRRHSLPAVNCRLHASSTNQHETLQRDWEDIETSRLKSQLELLRLNVILPTAMSADSQGSDAEDVKGILGKRDKRTSRACLTCRKRKSACELSLVDGVVTPPCKRCKATGLECVIGSSNRGGRRVRRKTTHDDTTDIGNNGESSMLSNLDEDVRPGALRGDYSLDQAQADGTSSLHHPPTPGIVLDPALQNTEPSFATRESSTTSNMFGGHELQNPSDALGILAQIASHSNGDNPHPYSMMQQQPMKDYQPAMHYGHNSLEYPLVRDGRLSVSKVIQLLQRYKMYYHPYFPLVPSATLDAGNLAKTAREEPHLLTAVLVVASRDLVDDPNVFTACTEYMRSLVSALSAGGPSSVSSVEALLLLAEWAPYTSRSDAGHVGRGEEDREAWMHIGIALRIGYFLGLDRYSFHVRGDDVKDPQWQRKRLVWTACYISDRQISIRLGRAFWSRGPGPLTTLRKEDFPMLAPMGPGDEDYASIFQATLELTLLFSNVHDVLYSNPGNSMRNHLAGGYIKYIDDFRSAIVRIQSDHIMKVD